MSYGPGGYEDFDSDSDDLDMEDDLYDYKAVSNPKSHAHSSVNNCQPTHYRAMPAGVEQESSDDEGIYFAGNTRSSTSASRTMVDNKLPSTGGKGRGRGRGGFPAALHKTSTRDAKPSQPFPRQQQQQQQPKKNRCSASPMAIDELRVAVTNRNVDALIRLLDQGISPDVTLKSGWTSLMHAASTACSEVLDLLVKRGANVNFQKDMYSVLMAACSANGDVEDDILQCVELLLDKGARVNVYDRYRMSPLMYAAKEGRVSVCGKLIEKGAETNRQDMRGWTALSWAASRGHGHLVRVLLDHKAVVGIYSNDGQSPSDIAYTNGYNTIADILDAALTGKERNQNSLDLSRDTHEHQVESSPSFDKYGDLQLFLCGLELAHLLPKFQEHKITFDYLLKLTEKDLAQIGVSHVGVQKTILDAVHDVHKKEWDTASLQRIDRQTLSPLEVTTILANVAKHVSFVQSSAVYVTKHLEDLQQSAGFVQDVSQAEGLVKFSKEAAKQAAALSEQLDGLQKQVEGLSLKASQNAPDLIIGSNSISCQPRFRQPCLVLMGAVILGFGFVLVKTGFQQA